MAINLILPGDDIGSGFNKSNTNFKQQIVSAEVVNGSLRLNKYDGTYFSAPLPIPSSGGQIVSPVGSIILGSTSGTYNQVTISSIDYIYDGTRFNIPTSTVLNLSIGDTNNDRIDAIILDVTTNTIGVVAGTPATPPVLPTLTSTQLLVGAVYVKKGATSLLDYHKLVFTAFTSQQSELQANAQSEFDNLGDLLDVNITSPTAGQKLSYNGSSWINSTDDAASAGNGLSSDNQNVFSLGDELNSDVDFTMNSNSINFNGTKTTSIDTDGNIGSDNTFKIYNDDLSYEFNSTGVKASNGSGSLQLETGLTAGSTQSFIQTFPSKSGTVANLDDIPSYVIPNEEIVFGDGSSLTSSSTFRYTPSFSLLSGNSDNVFSGGPIYSTLLGGLGNTMNGSHLSFITGGQGNSINTSNFSAIVVGTNNIVESSNFTALGGTNNLGGQGSNNSVIIGGQNNGTTQSASSVVSGVYNNINNTYTGFIGGGQGSVIDNSSQGFIGGGITNTINNISSNGSITGGSSNTIDLSLRAGIVGGSQNTIQDNSNDSFIGGGVLNIIDGTSEKSAIMAGEQITISQSSYAFVTGYINDIQSSWRSSIIGGEQNSIYQSYNGTILGSQYSNIINSPMSSIIGGEDNNINLSQKSGIFGSNHVNIDSGDNVVILGFDGYSGGFGTTFSSYTDTTIVKDILVVGSTKTQIGGVDYTGITGTFSSPTQIVVKNGIIISVT